MNNKKNKWIFQAFIVLFIFIQNIFIVNGQDTITVNEVNVVTYVIKQHLLQIPAAAATVDSTQLVVQKFNSLVPVFNSIPGIRMEERSPGSYRLSIRGSLLRSPFGVRNIKTYFDEFPLTDAGGNTYLNLVPAEALNRIEILKGPDGSLFGANSGGVVTLMPPKLKNGLSGEVSAGSYGLVKQNLMYAKSSGKHDFAILQNFYNNNGYRENSRMKRIYLQANNNWQYSASNKLSSLFFFSDLYYQTPGGLTLSQFQANPSQARPATATLPGAAAQKSAVYNKMFFGGISHTMQFTPTVKNVFSVFASMADFRNPFITNYETRAEASFGGRAYFVLEGGNSNTINWEYNAGGEWQQTNTDIHNYKNNAGVKGLLLAYGKIKTRQSFIFNRLKLNVSRKFIAEAGISLNYYRYLFSDSFKLDNSFKPQWMPRLAVSYSFGNLVFRSSISKGYSPPTTAEIRPSDNRLNNTLDAESGVNIEIGSRYFSADRKLWVDVSAYNYRLAKAIVQQKNALDQEFFLNAGNTVQNGLELQCSYLFISPAQGKSIRKVLLASSNTFAHYKFKTYVSATGNYSGKFLTGVPKFITVNNFTLELKNTFFVFVQYNHTSSLPLNDANTSATAAFDIVQIKTGFDWNAAPKFSVKFFAGADNLFNARYSLGNDLNAAGGRFYNAALLRNFFIGAAFSKN